MAGSLVVLGLGTGCEKEAVRSYQTPKETYTPRLKGVATAGDAEPAAAMPHLHWDLPTGWVEKKGEQLRAGSFRIEGEEGKFAEVRIVPLRGASGIEAQTVNMWREELGLPVMATNQIKAAEADVAGLKGHLFDLTSEQPRFLGKFKARTTAVILPRNDTLWFIKMSGEESIVAKEQDAFKGFIRTLSFHDEEHEPAAASASTPETAPPPASAADPEKSKWPAPTGWQELAPGQMVMAAYKATKGAGTADITVSSFPGDVGGLLANVNRWRGQVQAAPITEADLAKEVKSIELESGARASVVDVAGTNPKNGKPGRLYGLVVPRGGKTWFYKMVGDAEAVAAETESLARFAATAY